MIDYCEYLRYFIIHKLFVFIELCKRGYPWLGFMHDWSKLLPSEIIDYSRYWYGSERTETSYQKAWNLHKTRNKHHWQYWVTKDGEPMSMPEKYIIEMICDWDVAGRFKSNGIGTRRWYEKFKHNMVLHPKTKELLEKLIYDKSDLYVLFPDKEKRKVN